MSILEVYETSASLRELPRGVPLPRSSVRCVVAKTIATRFREFAVGVVFTVEGTLRTGCQGELPENKVHINFYDDWAHGASFIDPGDIIIVKGFTVVPSPSVACDVPAPTVPYYIVPLAKKSSLRVLQEGEQGDTMEVTVTPESFDMPRVRVLPLLDHLNRCYVNDVKKASVR